MAAQYFSIESMPIRVCSTEGMWWVETSCPGRMAVGPEPTSGAVSPSPSEEVVAPPPAWRSRVTVSWKACVSGTTSCSASSSLKGKCGCIDSAYSSQGATESTAKCAEPASCWYSTRLSRERVSEERQPATASRRPPSARSSIRPRRSRRATGVSVWCMVILAARGAYCSTSKSRSAVVQ